MSQPGDNMLAGPNVTAVQMLQDGTDKMVRVNAGTSS